MIKTQAMMKMTRDTGTARSALQVKIQAMEAANRHCILD